VRGICNGLRSNFSEHTMQMLCASKCVHFPLWRYDALLSDSPQESSHDPQESSHESSDITCTNPAALAARCTASLKPAKEVQSESHDCILGQGNARSCAAWIEPDDASRGPGKQGRAFRLQGSHGQTDQAGRTRPRRSPAARPPCRTRGTSSRGRRTAPRLCARRPA
jgi:hypothetical protein